MGLGAALIFPATLSLLTNVFTERRERARAIGLWGATTGVGIAVGPIVGGWLLEHFSWPSVFFALAPIAALRRVLVAVDGADLARPRGPSGRPTGPRALDRGDGRSDLHDHRGAEPRLGGRRAASPASCSPPCCSSPSSPGSGASTAPDARRRPVQEPPLQRGERCGDDHLLLADGLHLPVTLYFQFLKGYGPLSTGVRLLPVAILAGITSVLGTRLAVRSGTKLVVAGGMVSLAVGLAWASTAVRPSTSYLTIAGQMVLIGAGIGLTSAPATESIMGAVPRAKAGVGSAVNDATRILGGTLGVAVIGSIYASLYASRLTESLRRAPPGSIADSAQRSVGTAFGAAAQLDAAGQPGLAQGLHDAASNAFFDGFQTAVLVAAGIALAGAVVAAILIPSQPPETACVELEELSGPQALPQRP